MQNNKNYVGGHWLEFILYVYQNTRWFIFLNTPKIIQNVPPKKYIFLAQNGPHIVLSPEITQLKS